MKPIFITGASTGLGHATAKLFASKGWKVIATMRRPETETALNLIDNITLLPLDVTNPAQYSKGRRISLRWNSGNRLTDCPKRH